MTKDIFSKSILSLSPSMTLSMTQKAAEMKEQGIDIISLSAGESDFSTPDVVKEAAKIAIDNNMTRYTAVDGLKSLKEAIIYKTRRDSQFEVIPSEIIVSTGAKQSLFNLFYTLLNQGDEVIISAPYWVSYPEMVKACQGTPVIVPTRLEDQFFLTPDKLRSALSAKTKLLILNSPSNPTGQVMTQKQLQDLADVLIDYPHVFICCDEIYEHLCWDYSVVPKLLQVAPYLKERVIIINGVSKAYSMTGWRIGWAIAPPKLVTQMKKIQSQSTSNPCTISQMASIAALMAPLEVVQEMKVSFEKRHEYFYQKLSEHPLLKPLRSQGTFYLFVDATLLIEHLGLKNDLELAYFLLEKKALATVPGSAFGQEGYLRISFTQTQLALDKAVERFFEKDMLI